MDKPITCLGCGYNLRGLDEQSKCPECGHPIAESRAAAERNSISRRELAAMFIRLIAVWMLLQMAYYAIQVPQIVFLWVGGTGVDVANLAAGTVGVVAMLSVLAALWYWAPAIAARLVPTDGRAFDGPFAGPQEILRIGCTLVGLYFLVVGLSALAGGVVGYLFVEAQYQWYMLNNLWTHIFQAGLGLLLIVGSRRLARLVRSARTFGTD